MATKKQAGTKKRAATKAKKARDERATLKREHAAAVTNLSRTLAQSVTPAAAGWIMQGLSLTAPFFLGGGLKIVYDLLLYATIRNVKTK